MLRNASSTKTFGSILNDYNGAGPGFDVLRLSLALVILAAHCSGISGTRGFLSSELQQLLQYTLHFFWPSHQQTVLQSLPSAAVAAQDYEHYSINGLGRPFTLSHVPMFFALSGFLVTGSAYRTKRVFPFLALRFFRIFPALLVEVTLSAIVLGALFTTLPLPDYYASPGFFSYFGNILGLVQLWLPDVSFNGSQIVNYNLWTLPAEFHSYLIAAVLIAFGLFLHRTALTLIFILATIPLLVLNIFFDYQATMALLPADVNIY